MRDLCRLCLVISILCPEHLFAASLPSAPPDPILVKSVMRRAAEQLAIPEVSMTVFADSLCVQGYHQPQTLLTPFVTYRTGAVPDKDILVAIIRYKYAVLFKCSEFKDDRYYRNFGCRLLFTLHANSEGNTRSRVVDGTTVYVTPEGSIRTEMYIESDVHTKSKYWRTRSGVDLPPQDSKCLKLTDVTALNSFVVFSDAHESELTIRSQRKLSKGNTVLSVSPNAFDYLAVLVIG